MASAANRHSDFEIASFHTPGHKGRALSPGLAQLQQRFLRRDLTELPGLDDLTSPDSVIAQIESRAAVLWGAQASLLSLSGASAGLVASIVAAARSGRKSVALPRNVHRSVVNGLILSGLNPIWYEPTWDSQWNLWGHVSPQSIELSLQNANISDCAALVLVSPTYAGATSDVQMIAERCKRAGVTLIVDEAHGAHQFPLAGMAPCAVPFADVTVQSLHKTLSAFTQTGLVHVSPHSALGLNDIRSAMNLVHSSSPSYPLMISIEETVTLLERPEGMCFLANLKMLSEQLCDRVAAVGGFEIYKSHHGTDPAHVLIRHQSASADELDAHLRMQRVFSEALLGEGLLLMLGIGSAQSDVDALVHALETFEPQSIKGDCAQDVSNPHVYARPAEIEQVLSPREAFFLPSEMVAVQDAVGRIAHECVAPCPPGIPLTIPGQRVHPEVMNVESLRCLRVVKQ